MSSKGKVDRKSLRDVFDKFDTDKSNSLSVTEIVEAFAVLNIYPNATELNRIMQEMDTNGDNVLDFEEFELLFTNVKKSASDPHVELRRAFDQFDRNKDGKLSRDEFWEIMGEKGDLKLTKQEFDALMKMVDTNGDGEIDPEEYIAFMCEM